MIRLIHLLDLESLAEVLEYLDKISKTSSCIQCGGRISVVLDAFCPKCGLLNLEFSGAEFQKRAGRTLFAMRRMWCSSQHRESKTVLRRLGMENYNPYCSHCGTNLAELFSQSSD